MARVGAFALAALLTGCAAARAQVHDGIDNPPSEQRVADEFRDAGSKCGAPACRAGASDGIAPPSTRPGENAKTPSISAGQEQPRN